MLTPLPAQWYPPVMDSTAQGTKNPPGPPAMNDCPDGKSTCGDDPGTDTGAPGVDLFGGSPSGGDLSDLINLMNNPAATISVTVVAFLTDSISLGDMLNGSWGPSNGGGGGGSSSGNGFFRGLLNNARNLDVCIENNAKNFSIGGVINLTTGFDPPFLGNQVTDTAILLTGQAGLVDAASGTAGLGKDAFQALNKPIMTNGPNSFTTLVAQRGSPQPVLGSGTNHSTSFLGKLAKVAGVAKGAADLGLSGALVVDCLAGKVK